MRTASKTATAGVLALAGCGLVAATAAGSPSRPGAPPRSASAFSNPRANPYYPLTAGFVARYRGTDGGKRFHERVTMTHTTRTIQGVRARVSLDVLRRADGSLAERTDDYYADDNHGNVWYFGEKTATYNHHGQVNSREGSWLAGRHGAVAGMIMPARPRPTDAYRQEFWPGHAEDQAWIVQNNDKTTVPYGRVRHVVRTIEWSRLEPNVLSVKLYGRGLGIVGEHDAAGGSERFVLVSVSHG